MSIQSAIRSTTLLQHGAVRTSAQKDRNGGSLSGLIHREAPRRFDPVGINADHEAAVAAVKLGMPVVKPRPVDPRPLNRQTKNPRRQLTVRVGIARFGQLDRLAKSTGRTYQDILAKALDHYFEVFPVKIGPIGPIGTLVKPCFVKRGPAKRRRQLTVRIEMTRFAQLDYLAKSTGQTYQAILSRAIDRYLWAYPVAFIKVLQREIQVDSSAWEPARDKDVTPQRQARQAPSSLADLIVRANFARDSSNRPQTLLGARTA